MSRFIKFTNLIIKTRNLLSKDTTTTLTRIIPIRNLLYFDINRKQNIVSFYFKNNFKIETSLSNSSQLANKLEKEIKKGKVIITIKD